MKPTTRLMTKPLLEPQEVLALAWLAGAAQPNLRPEAAAAVIIRTLAASGYKIVPLEETESRECQSGRRT